MIDHLPVPQIDDPYAQHLEIMRLVLNMNTGAAKSSVRPIIDGAAESTPEQVRVFGIAIADAIRSYAEAVAQAHGLDRERVIRSVVTSMRCEMAAPTGGGLAVQVDDDLALREGSDVLVQSTQEDPRGDDLADRAIRGGQDDDRTGAGPEAAG